MVCLHIIQFHEFSSVQPLEELFLGNTVFPQHRFSNPPAPPRGKSAEQDANSIYADNALPRPAGAATRNEYGDL